MAVAVYPPSLSLRPFIRSFTIEETAEPTIRKVLPGTGTVMGFQFRGSLSIVAPASQLLIAANSPQLKFSADPAPVAPPGATDASLAPDIPLAPSGITGLQDSFRKIGHRKMGGMHDCDDLYVLR
ncbi:MAG TPA: hypothetical protein VNV35_02055 [Puia sp.]|jgi:hypothetical protein|nr:hypothetical protein [Puia sp.]